MIKEKNIEEKLKKDGFIISTFKGNSMYPFLSSSNDKVVIERVNDINMYDTVLYKVDGKYILHRIIGIKDDCYLIRGDNCINTEIVNKSCILGVLRGFYNKDEYVEIDSDINRKAYVRSKRSLLYRRVKGKIKRLLQKVTVVR